MLCWVLAEQVGHGHMSDEYKRPIYYSRYFGIPHLWYQILLEITTVGPQRTNLSGEEHADKQ